MHWKADRAIVIGGGSGIGLGVARLLAHDGAPVTIAGRTEQKLHDASALLGQEELEVATTPCDALDPAGVHTAVNAASDEDRRLDITVVVPGGGSIKPVLSYEDDELSREVDANVRPSTCC